ncbi:uncharacterized protein LOC113146766 [Cyclospora cayetanensis]|uniref:Uncharacterized protein LOC113146766 n=1 Tax=Cyclospora cayetanensis TaxID=88456 RepID=A0A6P6RUQ8_9EIME|nr:uncharacterized protein LOC113146766 [Cyclospora cayetanensis]
MQRGAQHTCEEAGKSDSQPTQRKPMTQRGASSTQGPGTTRRATKRQRQRSVGGSPREGLPSARQQVPDPEPARLALSSGVRTRRSAATELPSPQLPKQSHTLEHLEQQQLETPAHSACVVRQSPQHHAANAPSEAEYSLQQRIAHVSRPSVKPPTNREWVPDLSGPTLKAEAPTKTPARRHRRRRGGTRRLHRCPEEPPASLEQEPLPPEASGPSRCLRPDDQSFDSLRSPTVRGPGYSAYEKLLLSEEERGKQLLRLLHRARSVLLEPLLDIAAHLPPSGACATGGAAFLDSSEEPTVWHRDPHGGASYLRVFSGATYLSHKHVAALSQTAAGMTFLITPYCSMLNSQVDISMSATPHTTVAHCPQDKAIPLFAVADAPIWFCMLQRVRYGLDVRATASAGKAATQAGDFLTQCVRAWKSYTLSLLLLKYLYARGADALSHQQPAFLGASVSLQTRLGGVAAESLLAAEAAGIQNTTACRSTANETAKILCQATSIDEAAVIIFGRFVIDASLTALVLMLGTQWTSGETAARSLQVPQQHPGHQGAQHVKPPPELLDWNEAPKTALEDITQLPQGQQCVMEQHKYAEHQLHQFEQHDALLVRLLATEVRTAGAQDTMHQFSAEGPPFVQSQLPFNVKEMWREPHHTVVSAFPSPEVVAGTFEPPVSSKFAGPSLHQGKAKPTGAIQVMHSSRPSKTRAQLAVPSLHLQWIREALILLRRVDDPLNAQLQRRRKSAITAMPFAPGVQTGKLVANSGFSEEKPCGITIAGNGSGSQRGHSPIHQRSNRLLYVMWIGAGGGPWGGCSNTWFKQKRYAAAHTDATDQMIAGGVELRAFLDAVDALTAAERALTEACFGPTLGMSSYSIVAHQVLLRKSFGKILLLQPSLLCLLQDNDWSGKFSHKKLTELW